MRFTTDNPKNELTFKVELEEVNGNVYITLTDLDTNKKVRAIKFSSGDRPVTYCSYRDLDFHGFLYNEENIKDLFRS